MRPTTLVSLVALALLEPGCGSSAPAEPPVAPAAEPASRGPAGAPASDVPTSSSRTSSPTASPAAPAAPAPADLSPREWLVTACDGGDPEACRIVAVLDPRADSEALRARARDALRAECEGCAGEACAACIELAQDGDPLDPETLRAAAVALEGACAGAPEPLARGRACAALTAAAIGGTGRRRSSRDHARLARRAASEHRAACEAGLFEGCAALGSAHWEGVGVAHDEAEAERQWDRARTLATAACPEARPLDHPACRHLAQLALSGR